MQEMTYGVLQRTPSLVSLSTIAMATDFQYECPSGMYSLLCAVTGSCTLIAADRKIRLVGSRMAFLSGSLCYQMKDASPDLSVTRLDFSTGSGGNCGYGLNQLERVYPRVRNLMEGHGIFMIAFLRRAGPEMAGESDIAAVKVINAMIVQRHLIFLPIDGELAGGNAIAVASHGVSHGAVRSNVAIQRIKSKRYIIHVSASIRNNDAGQNGAPFNHRDGSPHGIGQGKTMDILSLWRFSPDFSTN